MSLSPKPPRGGRITLVADEAERAANKPMNDWIRGAAGLVPDDEPPTPPTGMNRELRERGADQNPPPRLKYVATSMVERQNAALSRLFRNVPKTKKEDPQP